MPKFSIILATRDRPDLFREALESVSNQTFQDFEVIVVNDGSSPQNVSRYETILADVGTRLGERLKSHFLVHRPNGHGQSYSLNFGVAHASGEYVGFLDDDDSWTDLAHLARAAEAITNGFSSNQGVELYMSNQNAYIGEQRVEGTIWLEGLEGELVTQGVTARADGSYPVSLEQMVAYKGFCHLNCLIVKRDLYEGIGGMDEGIRWECDRDLFIRLIDKSRHMIHHPATISRHNVPDPKKAASMTTSLSMIQKRLYQLRVLDKAALFSDNAPIRRRARRHKTYALQKIARELVTIGQWRSAAFYAGQALGGRPSFSWLLFTLRCVTRSLLDRGRPD